MGKPTGFKEYTRELPSKRPVAERVRDYREFVADLPEDKLRQQGARCMNCGVPFCHTGCPLGNIIPDFNDLVYLGRWEAASDRLHATNNFPEFTGRLCPAPCEESCVLGINEPPVTIEQIEKEIVERAFREGWIKPEPPEVRTGRKVAVVGSGPAGLACAQQLNRAGHGVVVFEREDRIGGLLRYGIPDFKMEKGILDRRLKVLEAEGIVFKTGQFAGRNLDAAHLREDFDAVVLCIGATQGRDLKVPGRELAGIHLAMDFLPQQNRRVAGDPEAAGALSAKDKHVIVIGGGDTGSDCIGTSIRHGARSVTNFELLPMPPKDRPAAQPWPYWPMKLRTSTSHDEGCERVFSVSTRKFIGANGRVTGLQTVNVEFQPQNGGPAKLAEVPGSEREWKADLVLLAMGFTGPEPDSIVAQLGVALDGRGNIRTDAAYRTSVPGVYAAGDGRRGQSLIVWAISEGREAARCVDLQLMGRTLLPTKAGHDLPRA